MAGLRVNLTSKEAIKITRANRLIERIRLGAGILLGLFVMMMVMVYGYSFYVNNRIVVVDGGLKVVLAEIEGKSEIELVYRRLADVVQEANVLIKSRKDFAGVLLEVYQLLPRQVEIEGIRFEKDVVIVDIRGKGVQILGEVIKILSEITTKSTRFNSVVLGSIRRSDDGLYVVRAELGLTKAI